MPKDKDSEGPVHLSLRGLGLTWNAALNTVPLLYVSSLALLRESGLSPLLSGKTKSIFINSSKANDYLPLRKVERYPVASVWHLPLLARGTLTALANMAEMLARATVYAKNIMVEECKSWNTSGGRRNYKLVERTC
jgi:hypothetical protein